MVSLRQNQTTSSAELRKHMEGFVAEGKIARFWLPDEYMISQEPLPKSNTGKLDKKVLRERYPSVGVTS